jgi:hypothetical protein
VTTANSNSFRLNGKLAVVTGGGVASGAPWRKRSRRTTVMPRLMGYISDRTNIRYAFLVHLICHIYVRYFAVRGYRPETSAIPADDLRNTPIEN